nr:DUF3368 domain-containing protein [Candidatus Chloroploca mongolica]
MGAGKLGADLVREAAWITVRAVEQTNLVRQLHRHLDAGEAESIVLAQEQGAQLLLIDEQQGRRIAAQYGLVYTGLLGVLVAAKRQGILGAVTPLLDALRYEAGFWISQPLYDRIIDEVGE